MKIEELEHPERKLPSGATVLLLNTGAVITPEAEAMLQALHSRSVGGISEHLKVLASKGAEKFMSTNYVGYGHKSIGDCGTCTIFVEGVSMLVAKAIQDWPLYSGQEASTRYIDFSQQKFFDPKLSFLSDNVLKKWRSFYLKGLAGLPDFLKERFPKDENDKESDYKKAINARAFDIMRGFLPAGATTNLAWHSNLRQIADKLLVLRHHPLQEVQDITRAIEEVVAEAYPSSFSLEKRYAETEDYNSSVMAEYFYEDNTCPDFEVTSDNINRDQLRMYERALKARPPRTELPKYISETGTMQFRYLLDFGSFRDIQRHRAVSQRMPLVTDKFGFEEWYLSELPPYLREEAEDLLTHQKKNIEIMNLSKEESQYFTPMGYKLSNRLTGNIHALVYLAELRSTRFVHPTARRRALQIANELSTRFGELGLKLHLDEEPGRFDTKRGTHDIVAKETV
jgi:thymidylate synthase ThyX